MRTFFTLLTVSFLYQSVVAQSDLVLIEATLENYFNGYVDRDLDLLERAFDTENGVMKLPSGEASIEVYENGLFKDIVKKWAARDPMLKADKAISRMRVLNIDIVSDLLASAKIEFKIGKTVYIDLLTLQRLGDNWKITNKSFIELE